MTRAASTRRQFLAGRNFSVRGLSTVTFSTGRTLGRSALSASRRAGSLSLAIRSSAVPIVASRQASESSYMFQPSAKVNVNPPPLVTHWG